MSAFDWCVVFGGLMCASSLQRRSRALVALGLVGWLLLSLLVGGLLSHFGAIEGGLVAGVAGPLVPDSAVSRLRRVDAPVAVPPQPSAPLPPAAVGAAEATLLVYAAGCRDAYWGSGWVIARGRAVTAAHVVAGASRVELTRRGESFESRVLRVYPERDLALVSVPRRWKPLRRGTVGRESWVVGHPDGGDRTVVPTAVVSRYLRVEGLYGDPSRVSVLLGRGAVVGGMSGGPLLDRRGGAVGTLLASTERGLLAAPPSGLGGASVEGPGRCLD